MDLRAGQSRIGLQAAGRFYCCDRIRVANQQRNFCRAGTEKPAEQQEQRQQRALDLIPEHRPPARS